jgi:hypothetical protein
MPKRKQSEPAPGLFPKDYLARPKIDSKARGDATPDEIFHAVGLALTQSESAECALAMLFQVLSGAEPAGAFHALRRAFGSIEHSAGRRKALEATAEIYFGAYWANPLIKKPFNAFIKAFERGSSRRDEIAHGMAYSVVINNEQMGAFLFPAEYNTQRTFPFAGSVADDPLAFSRAKYRYTAAIIRNFANAFGDLRTKVWEYIRSIKKVGGVPAVILDAQGGEGTAEKLEAMLADESAKKVRTPQS